MNNAGSGISGGWVTVMNQWNQAFAGDAMPQLIFTGAININSGVFGTDNVSVANAEVLGSATVNIASGGVLAMRYAAGGWTIGSLNGTGAVTPATSRGAYLHLDRRRRQPIRQFHGHHPRQQYHGRDGRHDRSWLFGADEDRHRHANPFGKQYLHRRHDRWQRLAQFGFLCRRTPTNNILASTGVVNLNGGTLGVNAGSSGSNGQTLGTVNIGAGGLSISNGGGNMTLTAGSLTPAAGGMMFVNLANGTGSNTLTVTNTSTINPTRQA